MELIDTINKIIKNNIDAQKPTDLAIGTVVSTSPLSVSLNANLPPLPEQVLILTDVVKNHVVKVYNESGTTEVGRYMIKADLQVNDKVLMLRCMKGQTYIILSKL